MSSSTFVARRPGQFPALVQTADLGGLRLQALPPVRARDRFFDTADGALLHRDLALRVREQDGVQTAALRALAPETAPRALPPDATLPAGAGPLELPPGPLAEFVRGIIGDDALQLLLALRQYRTPRVAFRGDQPVALLSFDVVAHELASDEYVSDEAEIEPLGAGGPEDVERIAEALRGRGLEPTAESKFERGLVRLRRPLSEPVLLAPRERRELEETATAGPPLLRRRARVVLLDARGFRPDTIATQTGLSMARVRAWREQFREVRMGILDPAFAALAPLAPPVRNSAAPPPSEPPAADPVAEPWAAFSEGDGMQPPADPTQSRDLAELLDLFTPGETSTPLLGPEPDVEEDLERDLDEDLDDVDVEQRGGAGLEQAPFSPSPRASEAPPAAPPSRSRQVAYPVVLGPFARTVPPARRPSAQPSAAPQVAPAAQPERPPPAERLRRPHLTGETPLLQAAQQTIAYHVAGLDRAVGRLAGRSQDDVRRLLVACHRVRLAVEAFRRVLPEQAADKLVSALRPLVADLDVALDLGRASAAYGIGRVDLAVRRAQALESALGHLGADRQRDWAQRAQRLLRRLSEQSADGLLLSDDAPPPPDDFVGQQGGVPVPSRLGHVIGSMLWSRYEAVRAFEGHLEGDVDAETSYRLATAISGLHFVLGLAAKASEGPIQEVAAALTEAEQQVAEYRHARRTGELVGAPADGEAGGGAVREAWRRLIAPEFRAQLAAVAAAA